MHESVLSIPFTLADLVERTATLLPEKLFLSDGSVRLTYSRTLDVCGRLAKRLKDKGFGFGDRLVLACSNSATAPLFLFACAWSGGIFVPVSPALKGRRLSFVLSDCLPKIVVTDSSQFAKDARDNGVHTVLFMDSPTKLVESVRNHSALGRSDKVIDLDVALLIYTSGSAGYPKGVSLSHSSIISATESIARYLGISDADRIINFNPFYFDYGLYQVFLTTARGASLFIVNGFALRSEAYSVIKKERITCVPFVPAQIISMYDRKESAGLSFPTVRMITNTGAPFPHTHIRDLRRTFPRARIFSMYGLTECKRVSFLAPEKLFRKPTSVGNVMPNVKIQLVDDHRKEVPIGKVGQLVVEGRNLMTGYWNNPRETKRVLQRREPFGQNLLMTGDYFVVDADGDMYFRGRKDDIVKSGGIRISTRDVEKAILSHPSISEVAVVAIPEKTLGTIFHAFVVLKPAKTLTATTLITHIARQVESQYMVPRRIHFSEILPRTATGKTDYAFLKRKALRQSRIA